MQWTAEFGAGFSDAAPESFWLPVVASDGFTPNDVNVADQQADPGSLLSWVRQMLGVRRERPEMGFGEFDIVEAGDRALLAYVRTHDDARTLVVANFSRKVVRATVDGATLEASSATDVVRSEPVRLEPDGGLGVDIEPLTFHWIGLNR